MFLHSGILWALLAASASAKVKKVDTPPMGWNTFNAYNCYINEEKVKKNAQDLVTLGLRDHGYNVVTTDCAWNSQTRDKDGRMTWNATTFPSGGKALGDFLHEHGLLFGMYSGAGYKQCNPWEIDGSLHHEDIDAQTFADWGADTLKYDNCFAAKEDEPVSGDPEFNRPERFQAMAQSLNKVQREIQYLLCQWGRGPNVGRWASKIGTTWRITADIGKDWDSIWRITNQATAYASTTGPGGFADMDMLIVGNKNDGKLVLTPEQEKFHFKMWAINKSPLIIGAILDEMPQDSLETLKKKEIIAINQDPLGKAARLVQRYTEEQYDIWLGDLSGNKKVLGVANWKGEDRNINFDLRTIGIEAADVRDPWTPQNMGRRSGVNAIDLNAHELKLWVLSNIETVKNLPTCIGTYRAENATVTGTAKILPCEEKDKKDCNFASRIRYLGKGSSATFQNVPVSKPGKKSVNLDFVNFEEFEGDRVRNIYIAVNDNKPRQWHCPLSGQSWNEAGRFTIQLDGFKKGNNKITFSTSANDRNWGPDIVGFEIFESPFEIESETANYTSGSKSPQSPQETPHAGQEHVDNRSKPNAGAVVTFPAWGVASLAVTLAFLW